MGITGREHAPLGAVPCRMSVQRGDRFSTLHAVCMNRMMVCLRFGYSHWYLSWLSLNGTCPALSCQVQSHEVQQVTVIPLDERAGHVPCLSVWLASCLAVCTAYGQP
jgi:hypothetical protein